MDRDMQRHHLREAERHIADGERHIAEQEARIIRLDRDGHSSELARSLLDTFNAVQRQHIAHRDLIMREIET